MKSQRGGAGTLGIFIPLVPIRNNFGVLGQFYKPGGPSTWKLSYTAIHLSQMFPVTAAPG